MRRREYASFKKPLQQSTDWRTIRLLMLLDSEEGNWYGFDVIKGCASTPAQFLDSSTCCPTKQPRSTPAGTANNWSTILTVSHLTTYFLNLRSFLLCCTSLGLQVVLDLKHRIDLCIHYFNNPSVDSKRLEGRHVLFDWTRILNSWPFKWVRKHIQEVACHDFQNRSWASFPPSHSSPKRFPAAFEQLSKGDSEHCHLVCESITLKDSSGVLFSGCRSDWAQWIVSLVE